MSRPNPGDNENLLSKILFSGKPYDQICGNPYDCDGMVDLIPVIETKDALEEESIYISSNNVPLKAVTDNELICLTRINYFTFAIMRK